MQINLDMINLQRAVYGKKTYIAVAIGMAVILLKRFDCLPVSFVPSLDPYHWISDEYQLVLAACFRAGIAKIGVSAPRGGMQR